MSVTPKMTMAEAIAQMESALAEIEAARLTCGDREQILYWPSNGLAVKETNPLGDTCSGIVVRADHGTVYLPRSPAPVVRNGHGDEAVRYSRKLALAAEADRVRALIADLKTRLEA